MNRKILKLKNVYKKKSIGLILLLFIECVENTIDKEVLGKLLIVNNFSEGIYLQIRATDKELNVVNFASVYKNNYLRPNHTENSTKIRQSDFLNKNYKYLIFIWKASTIERYSWQELSQNNIYDRKYVLSLRDIRDMNWQIVYDGN